MYKHFYKLLLLLLLLPLSCKTGKHGNDTNVVTKEPTINQANSLPPYENGSPLDSLAFMYPGIQQAMEEAKNQKVSNSTGLDNPKKTGFISRLFGSKKTKLKNSAININYQVAQGGSSIAPAMQTGNQDTKEKLKGQNAVKGDGNTSTANKSDKSLLWVVVVVVIATIAAAYFMKRNNV